MMTMAPRGLAFVAILALQLATASCAESTQGSKVANTLNLSNMRTHCVGRFLIDLPKGFEQTAGSDLELIYGLDKNHRTIKVQAIQGDGSAAASDAAVAERIRELSSRQSDETPTKSMLASVRKVDPVTTLIRGHEEPVMKGYFRSQLVARKEGAIALVVADIFKRDTPEVIEGKAIAVAERIVAVNGSSEARRGACLGPLLVDAGQDGETLSASFQTSQWPDVTFTVYINSMIAETGDGLLKRWDSKVGMLGAMGFKSGTLRRGKLRIAGRPAEELLSQGKEREHVVRHFSAEVLLDSPATLAAPQLSVDLDMGGQIKSGAYVPSSLDERDAVVLWDTVLKSIRWRPGSV